MKQKYLLKFSYIYLYILFKNNNNNNNNIINSKKKKRTQ